MKRDNIKKKQSIYTDGSYAEAHPEMHVPDSEWKAKNSIKILRENNLKPKFNRGYKIIEICNSKSVFLRIDIKREILFRKIF